MASMYFGSLMVNCLVFLFSLHLFFFFCISCEGNEALHDASARVRILPGFEGELPFELYTGYITICEKNENRLFYYFEKSQRNPQNDPLMLWLPGGPGYSALASMAYHIGPIKFKDVKALESDEPKLELNPYSWTKIASIIFLDFPTGAGFSYSKALEDYQTSETRLFKDVYKFLTQWFLAYPEFLTNPLYLGGPSHSGLTVPIVAHRIASDIEVGKEPRLNLKGYMVGNPYTNPDFDNQRIPFAHGMGLISDELYQAAKGSCGGKYETPSSRECANNIQAALQCVSGINRHHILEPNCESLVAEKVHLKGSARYLEEYNYPPYCRESSYKPMYIWANDAKVRDAIHVQKGTVGEWERLSKKFNLTHDVFDSIEYHLSLTKKGYRALIYSGDHDFVATFLGTEAWIRYLNFSIIDEWRSWMVDGQIGGFTRGYANNLTYATVKGAGHSAPEYKPKECYSMFYRWISSLPL